MLQAVQGRMAFNRGRGVIKHGTLRTARRDAVFFVFDVYAIDWKVVLEKLATWLGLIGCFGQAAYTTAKWARIGIATDRVEGKGQKAEGAKTV